MEAVCQLCRRQEPRADLDYAGTSRLVCHRGCVAALLPELAAPDAAWLTVVRELRLTGAAPGRPALLCPRGHPYAGENRVNGRVGERLVPVCRQCRARRQREYRLSEPGRAREHAARVTHKQTKWEATCCPNGHEYTEATLLLGPYGNKRCRECQRLAARQPRKRK